eukprot:403358823
MKAQYHIKIPLMIFYDFKLQNYLKIFRVKVTLIAPQPIKVSQEEKVQKKAKQLLNKKINELSKDLHLKYKNLLESEKSKFQKRVKQDEWKMPALIREAKDEIKKEKQMRNKRIFSKVQALNKMQLLNFISHNKDALDPEKQREISKALARSQLNDSLIESQKTQIIPRQKEHSPPTEARNKSSVDLNLFKLNLGNMQAMKRLSILRVGPLAQTSKEVDRIEAFQY